MFWGLIIEPHKRYAQMVEKSFHVSMACLEFNSNADAPNELASVMLDFESQEYILCNLHKQRSLQSPLDLNFKSGDEIAFFSSGKSRVHLTGYLLEEDFDDDDEDDDGDEDNTLDMDASDDEIEMPQIKTKLAINNKLTGKRKKESLPTLENKKKAKLTAEPESDDDDDIFNESDDEDEEAENEEKSEDDSDNDESEEDDEDEDEDKAESPKKVLTPESKNKNKLDKHLKNKSLNESQDQKKKKNKTPNGTPASGKKNKMKGNDSSAVDTPKGSQSPVSATKPLKKTLQGGVAVEDMRLGTGPVAKTGKRVTVYYVGHLKSNNKQFDSTMQGPGFKFHLGAGEVIKGWDIGVTGMKVGGKRRIICPPGMAYGDRGSPPVIPPQSTLVFEVELKGVN